MLCCRARRVCAAARSRGPVRGDATAKAHSASAVNGTQLVRFRVASTLSECGACSAVRDPNPAVRGFAPDADFVMVAIDFVLRGSHRFKTCVSEH